jgi:hypothetical protein
MLPKSSPIINAKPVWELTRIELPDNSLIGTTVNEESIARLATPDLCYPEKNEYE